ncbi:hypothetical protein [Actinomadura terrae]|uniref:hypothetical protein n=1 Tax=Actinomadura terrae TaxID=604353 RepID=UPI001FA7D456|nr:hypothetical protein [Actinomadura terrae]
MTLASSLRENKAVHTVAGAGDLAVEKLREVPEQVSKARENLDRYQDRAREAATRYQGDVRGTVDRAREQVREAVGRYRVEVAKVQDRVDTKDLPGAAIAYMTHVGTRTVEIIDELAERGRKVMHPEAGDAAGPAGITGAAEITEGGRGPSGDA